MLHGAGIFTNICPKDHTNVCKYYIHNMGIGDIDMINSELKMDCTSHFESGRPLTHCMYLQEGTPRQVS